MNSDHLIQDTLSDSRGINERVRQELFKAKTEVLIAMAWFTDNELFAAVQGCLDRQVKVLIIISDQPDNEKLDFSILEKHGAEVTKVKNVGWGMMNQKFCVIDKNVVITGSYNWSNNSKNNHVSVIITNYSKTVTEHIETFHQIRSRAIRINNGELLEDIIQSEKKENPIPVKTSSQTILHSTPVQELNFQQQSLKEYKDVLDNIIASEVGAFDKDLVKLSGYNRAYENSGDHQILHQAMDSLYSNFINEIDVIAEKKERLKVRIDEQQKLSSTNMEFKTEHEIEKIKNNATVDKQNIDSDINALTSKIEEKRLQIASNNTTKIPFIETKISSLKQKMKELEIEFVKPTMNKPIMFILGGTTLLLALYIFVFYSSVAYIFIFSKEEIKEMMLLGSASVESPEVFNPHAISKIGEKGAGGILFLFLFVAIPLALGMYKVFNDLFASTEKNEQQDQTIWNIIKASFINNLGIILILVVDIFIAYKVSKNINDIELLTNKTDQKLSLSNVMVDSNFWLVFILGALGVFLFSFFFEKFMNQINERNLSFQQQKSKHIAQSHQAEIEEYQEQINKIQLENDAFQAELVTLQVNKEEKISHIQHLPIQQNERIGTLQQQLLTFKERISNIGQIYKSQIDNDKLPISKAEMENRVNIYMEGWSKYLYEVYAILKAETKTREAVRECEAWLSNLGLQSDVKHELFQDTPAFNN
ncbi:MULTISPECIES: phospholipase D-like domain-containing protein [unclassified Sphingobacterium]|uniref:phospholipase D-like domain-containing protein n=1 Tax=unclassified Sphingobacterium TaxID=2609468 RepID=UPI0010434243|nr:MULTISPECIES: phospholipase D-like domain-containing protein [unclassified Sphingobacterium]MCS3557266.1 DNA-binding ferritin-like protein [Sphingobacterium sp. JUb21]TCQ96820.1 phospholipase D-like protein [Sphingobacterium sp. JUb20]